MSEMYEDLSILGLFCLKLYYLVNDSLILYYPVGKNYTVGIEYWLKILRKCLTGKKLKFTYQAA